MKKLLIFIGILTLLGGVVFAYTYSQRSNQKTSEKQPKEKVITKGDIILRQNVSYGEDPVMVYDVYYKEGYENAPVVFAAHGGGELPGKDRISNSVSTYADMGYVVMIPNFRYNAEGPSTAHDLACSISHFSEDADLYGADMDNTALQAGSYGNRSAGMLYFRPEHDWLKWCPYKNELPEFKGYIMKSDFHPGYIEGDYNFTYREDGVRITAPEEFVDEAISELESDNGYEIEDFGFDNEDLFELARARLMQSFLDFVDPGEGSVIVLYGENDKWWDARPDRPEWITSAFDENGINYYYQVIPDEGHGIVISSHPEIEEKVQEYLEAVFNGTELPF